MSEPVTREPSVFPVPEAETVPYDCNPGIPEAMFDREPMSDERLYGVPHAEWMQDDPAETYENAIEDGFGVPMVIEEWTVRPPSADLPHLDTVLDWVAEMACEDAGGEGYDDAWDAATKRPDVREAMRAALELIASHVGFKMADTLVATHTVTWDADGEPLFNGEPMYVATKGPMKLYVSPPDGEFNSAEEYQP